jgi:low affinity Fe/Cu permease
MSPTPSTPDSIRAPGSRLLHVIDQVSSRPAVALLLVTADLAWVALSVAVGFPTRLETIFQTLVAALTLAMVFVLQHTQARQELVTQRKLDELISALPRADNKLIALEDAADAEVAAAHAAHLSRRDTATAPQDGPGAGDRSDR